jgi:hypothetical protein
MILSMKTTAKVLTPWISLMNMDAKDNTEIIVTVKSMIGVVIQEAHIILDKDILYKIILQWLPQSSQFKQLWQTQLRILLVTLARPPLVEGKETTCINSKCRVTSIEAPTMFNRIVIQQANASMKMEQLETDGGMLTMTTISSVIVMVLVAKTS